MADKPTRRGDLIDASAANGESQWPSKLTLAGHGPSRLFRNTFALAVGRNLSALGRLVIASLIVRGSGAEMFGVYSVIVAVLAIADWALDFGTTDVFVREIVKNPKRYNEIRKSLIAFKMVQAPVAMALMITLLLSMHYPESVVHAGIVAAVTLGFFSGVAVYRSIFKATLTMEREMLAEFISVLLMIPLVMASIFFDLGIMGLMWSLFLSRAAFLAGCAVLVSDQSDDFKADIYLFF